MNWWFSGLPHCRRPTRRAQPEASSVESSYVTGCWLLVADLSTFVLAALYSPNPTSALLFPPPSCPSIDTAILGERNRSAQGGTRGVEGGIRRLTGLPSYPQAMEVGEDGPGTGDALHRIPPARSTFQPFPACHPEHSGVLAAQGGREVEGSASHSCLCRAGACLPPSWRGNRPRACPKGGTCFSQLAWVARVGRRLTRGLFLFGKGGASAPP